MAKIKIKIPAQKVKRSRTYYFTIPKLYVDGGFIDCKKKYRITVVEETEDRSA